MQMSTSAPIVLSLNNALFCTFCAKKCHSVYVLIKIPWWGRGWDDDDYKQRGISVFCRQSPQTVVCPLLSPPWLTPMPKDMLLCLLPVSVSSYGHSVHPLFPRRSDLLLSLISFLRWLSLLISPTPKRIRTSFFGLPTPFLAGLEIHLIRNLVKTMIQVPFP